MQINWTILLTILFLWNSTLSSFATKRQEMPMKIDSEIRIISLRHDANIGVDFSLDNRLYTYNDSIRYPLMSVFKLHVAVAALQRMEA